MKIVASSIQDIRFGIDQMTAQSQRRLSELQRRTGPGGRQRDADISYLRGYMRALEEIAPALDSLPSGEAS